MKVRLELAGVTPLLMHSVAGVDPFNPLVKQIKGYTGKRKKTEEDLEIIARLEFEVSMYYSPTLGPFIPGLNIERTLVEGARITKQGKTIERGLFITDNEVPLIYKGPRTVDELWADPAFRSIMAVSVSGRKIMRCRPLFREWALDCEAEVDTGVLSVDNLKSIVRDAGAMVGLGDFRPRYGRFNGELVPL